MTPTEKIDAALATVLDWIDGPLLTRHFDEMREAMRKIMQDSYINGANSVHDAMKGK